MRSTTGRSQPRPRQSWLLVIQKRFHTQTGLFVPGYCPGTLPFLRRASDRISAFLPPVRCYPRFPSRCRNSPRCRRSRPFPRAAPAMRSPFQYMNTFLSRQPMRRGSGVCAQLAASLLVLASVLEEASFSFLEEAGCSSLEEAVCSCLEEAVVSSLEEVLLWEEETGFSWRK